MTKGTKSPITSHIDNGIATITIDDHHHNVIDLAFLAQFNQALDQAEAAAAIVVVTGRPGTFSTGFDLKILKHGVRDAFNLLIGGFQLAARIQTFPQPVIIACSGHAIAMGAFLLLAADYRIGNRGPYKITANEVKIGLTLPYAALSLCRHRLNRPFYERATLFAEVYNPETALSAGYLDEVTADGQALARAQEYAQSLKALDPKAFSQSKARDRRKAQHHLYWAITKDRLDFARQGLWRLIPKWTKRY